MKRVNKDLLVLDNVLNTINFMNPETLAVIDIGNFKNEGYLKGGISLESDGGKYLVMWFSSGTIILVDAQTLKLIS